MALQLVDRQSQDAEHDVRENLRVAMDADVQASCRRGRFQDTTGPPLTEVGRPEVDVTLILPDSLEERA